MKRCRSIRKQLPVPVLVWFWFLLVVAELQELLAAAGLCPCCSSDVLLSSQPQQCCSVEKKTQKSWTFTWHLSDCFLFSVAVVPSEAAAEHREGGATAEPGQDTLSRFVPAVGSVIALRWRGG